ncbi:4-hydroxy-3-methylbut-2-enyl diphosphate reductase, putative [Perkinsus marinus ATCC 50983]|uniref:4-hydroxy-3-methylbut-2-enyl diphosphate reductase n=1 Tax=Perkinsus marinus (strain ATCC 50983 / TXsc) TaxID=423536 RepID=C5KI36_PERM5|nr:4-hydroxy-3-methylbut-2-enyl diphosphate reductase, putative [Perkinsus marinus ATCC 50983]EER16248.1 4-hydroxy-3-methylbut-2-enyl diphosphate reductase, putative [Perkinsus marinus ATCC 50983]|eukprot:XP_002784452.1 4-hydroxy-3-methylbut-2-enyl diphosphate reductase, putative [Perkinsus marinus ATCC 50983]
MAHRLIGATLDVPIVIGTYAFKKDESLFRWHALIYQWYIRVSRCTLNLIGRYVIKKVDFQLHETFAVPQRTVESTPFMVTEEGWGEFDIIVTIHFVDSSENPVRTTHKLKLHHDSTTTGINPALVPVDPVNEVTPVLERGYAVVNETYMELHFEHPHAWFYDAVWSSVERHKKGEYTSIIHGKSKHEETIATSSFADKYLILKNLKDAEYVCKFLLSKNKERLVNDFFEKFPADRHSVGFDPLKDLEKVGVANQTTMLKGETALIAKLFEKTVLQLYGPEGLNEHFVAFNTICDATQDRQDALYKLVTPTATKLDMMLVVGGFNSSNTEHLQEISVEAGGVKDHRAFHIDGPARIDELRNTITHKPVETPPIEAARNHGLAVTHDFLPGNGEHITIGVTSGASTPDDVLEQSLQKLLRTKMLLDSKELS